MVDKQLDSIVWCKESYGEASICYEAQNLLRQCSITRPPELIYTLQDLIDNSNRFPISFPVQKVRLENLKANTPVERLKRNATSTYPLLHERVLVLMANFLSYKRKYGSSIETVMYKDMTIPQLIDRILQKRAITFMKAQDQYKLITGEKGTDGWESVGTESEKPPLVLSRCLSYDEMELSALVYVSGYTECINDGTRKNAAIPRNHDVEREAVIIGVVGPRFKRINRMDYEDIVVSEHQNRAENGYGSGDIACDPSKRMWRQLWADFYQLPNLTHDELHKTANPVPPWFNTRWARVKSVAFDNTAYYRRLQLIFDTSLIEANARAQEADKFAFLNIIGAGLGVWKMSPHQVDIFVLAVIERTRALLSTDQIPRVAVVNLAYIVPGKHVLAMFELGIGYHSGDDAEESPKTLFLSNESHPRGGINVRLESRQPSSKLKGEHKGMLLVLTYPWDGNAHPGNEFWLGKLTTSGDPAAACSTQVSELHNAHINPAVCGNNTRVAGKTLRPLAEHCASL